MLVYISVSVNSINIISIILWEYIQKHSHIIFHSDTWYMMLFLEDLLVINLIMFWKCW